jgi:CelD/BcsL family acetyltransferase involved in cellulose biosynthesis
VRAEIIPAADLGATQLEQWRRLASVAVTPNPFFEPEFVLPSARAFGASDLALIVVRRGSEWLAALPVRKLARWQRVPGRVLAAWVHFNCFLGTPLVAGSDPEAIVAELVRLAHRERAPLALDRVDAGGELGERLTSVLACEARAVVLEEYERATLHRRPSNDYVEQTVSPHHRRELRRTRKRLAATVGELSLQECSGDPAAYDEFLRMEQAGWKGVAGTALASLQGQAEFFREMCSGFAAAGRLELLALRSTERTVAMKCNLLASDVTFCFKITFDEALARFSPGIHLELANIEHFHAGQSAFADSCARADNAMINRLWPGRRRLMSVVACPLGPRGRLAFAEWRAAAAMLRASRTRRSNGANNASPDRRTPLRAELWARIMSGRPPLD